MTTEQATEQTTDQTTESEVAPQVSIPPKPSTPPIPTSVTAEQMHVSARDYLGVRWISADLLRSYENGLRIGDKMKYQVKLDTTKGFALQESERLLYIAQEPLRVYLEKCNRIKWLTETRHRNIAVIGSKGGVGKTPLSAGIAAMLQAISQFACLIIDANHNDGTTGERLGIPRANHVLLLQALKDPALVKNYHEASMRMGRHKQTGLHALLSNPNSTQSSISLKPFLDLLKLLSTAYHSIVEDTGNGNEHPVNEGSFLAADVVISSALASKAESIGTALTTLLAFYRLGHKQKVKDALKVINATKPDNSKKEFLQKFREAADATNIQWKGTLGSDDKTPIASSDELLEELGITEENLFLVPFSRYIDANGVISLRPEDTGLATLNAYADILLRIFDMEVQSQATKDKEIARRLKEQGGVQNSDLDDVDDLIKRLLEKVGTTEGGADTLASRLLLAAERSHQ